MKKLSRLAIETHQAMLGSPTAIGAEIIQSAIDKAVDEKAAQLITNFNIERKELVERAEKAEAAAGFCDKHKPDGGHRNCLVCGCENLQHALIRISYLCETPNEMQVSDYSIHYNEDAVVKQLQDKLAKMVPVEDVKPLLELGSFCDTWKVAFLAKHGDKLK